MLRKSLIYICCLILASITAAGQQYRVCYVSSSPASVKLSNGKDVLRNNILNEKDMLTFEKFSKISLMEMKSKEMFFFYEEGEFSVANVVSKNKTQLKSNLKAHLKNLIQGKSHSRLAGVVYKDFADSVKYLDNDNLYIANRSGNIIQPTDIDANAIYYFVVSNTSDVPYFVNVIKTDKSGNKSACCISNDAMAQMDLFIPVNATVLLSAFPQLGKDLISASFEVVASESPFDANSFLKTNESIQVLSPLDNSTVSYPLLTIRYLIRDCNKLKSAELKLNGRIATENLPLTDGVNEINVKLNNYGENKIEFNTSDGLGNIYTKKVSVNFERINKPKLHIMSVGIGNYNDAKKNLNFAANDAAMVAKVLDSLRNLNLQLYSQDGFKAILTDADATKVKILKCLDDIRYATDPDDIVMIYMSGHGKEYTSQRYFLPFDAEDKDEYIESTSLSYSELRTKLKQLEDKECKVIVYIDACFAGEMYYTKAANDFIGDSEPAVIGFYSSTRNQYSHEKLDLNHGTFTYALLNGLKGDAKDSNGNITISSLGDYITEQVRIESQGRQTPKVDNGGEDFTLFKVSDNNIEISSQKFFTKKATTTTDDELKVNNAEKLIKQGDLYYYGNGGFTQSYKKAVEFYELSANLGNAEAQNILGYCYKKGQGVDMSHIKAAELYIKAALQGHSKAQCNLADCYEKGEGVDLSKEEALKWYRKSAEQGYDIAQISLGLYYLEGKVVPKSKQEAVKWFKKAAENGNVVAKNILTDLE